MTKILFDKSEIRNQERRTVGILFFQRFKRFFYDFHGLATFLTSPRQVQEILVGARQAGLPVGRAQMLHAVWAADDAIVPPGTRLNNIELGSV